MDEPSKHTIRLLLVPFWNHTERRPRALWRILGAFVLVAIGSQVIPSVLFNDIELPPSILGVAQNGFTVAIVLLVVVIWARHVDHRQLSEYGLEIGDEWIRAAGVGIIIAFVAWGLALVVHLSTGWAHISALLSPSNAENALPLTLAMLAFTIQFLFVGIWEELLFRGLILKNAAEGFQSRWFSERRSVLAGLVVSSVLFGVVHVGQANSLLALGFWVLMGLVLGSTYVVTDSLAIPIGLHFATNLAFNNVYGLSNVRPETANIAATLLRPDFTGPARFVGVSGFVNVGIVLIIATLAIGYVTIRYGSVKVRISPSYTIDSHSQK
ncbi:CPBP family intramembrane glutamic endopeptidase [Halobellus rufus]|uniref:CPBP family intramembrane glutamic endopeptidase n=1 Tax=Halobellus rufus TaxID=1448860 RepID=UPI000678CC1D|nr:CPBP family intramembrane glutamic endopeptidase [Halobellus rufus]